MNDKAKHEKFYKNIGAFSGRPGPRARHSSLECALVRCGPCGGALCGVWGV